MTTEEFVAWFDGFTRRIKGRPSSKDWNAILEAIGQLDGASPLKAWFEGLRVKVTGVPGEREWREIVKRVADEARKGAKKKMDLSDLFKAFGNKAKPSEKSKAGK